MTQAEHAARMIASADASDNLEEEALAWDHVQRESRPMDGFGITVAEFSDGSILAIVDEPLAFASKQAVCEWIAEVRPAPSPPKLWSTPT